VTVAFIVIIEKDATLDVCLLRVLECKLKLPKGAIMFSMRQNPQLYGGFAYEQQRFEEIARRQRDKIHVEETEGPDIVIYPLHLWRSVEKEVEQADGLLHMLVDRANSAGEEYSNNWTLEDGRIVARRGIFEPLVKGLPFSDVLLLSTIWFIAVIERTATKRTLSK